MFGKYSGKTWVLPERLGLVSQLQTCDEELEFIICFSVLSGWVLDVPLLIVVVGSRA